MKGDVYYIGKTMLWVVEIIYKSSTIPITISPGFLIKTDEAVINIPMGETHKEKTALKKNNEGKHILPDTRHVFKAIEIKKFRKEVPLAYVWG